MSHPSPHFPVPAGTNTVQVRIVDSTTRIRNLPIEFLMKPPMDGMQYMPTLPSWSFLIEHCSGKKLLFDLGVPKDWRVLSPRVVEPLAARGWDIQVDKEVIDVLEEGQVASSQINGIIWSHWHWDHLGDPSRFPPSTDLIVGPGFKEAFLPGFPAKADSPVRESDFRGRNVVEIAFDKSPAVSQVGPFQAFDYFGDGSFFLVDTPGHAIGHLSGLARTTANPDTFIFMGGDLCHHSGEMRPSKYLHIPSEIALPSFTRGTCPGAAFEKLLVERTGSREKPFFEPGFGLDLEEATRTIVKAQDADASENIWFIYAHDPSLIGTVDLFPLSANQWKEHGWRRKTLWCFLEDFRDAADVFRRA
ncbi:hypothetical protein Z517_03650 [Fonsecaea pedrosoi CBS 271.37]|uniref:Metallo-beta-lactamase domain-containing protein n=1 Tax=Fonsecaea pedrosoi CBS 271.37 TaxID=1442368 RepID=A0A0D2H0K9_9EURO|nr:uncharacterized protein Z517_03650 [Fonsecaea pedrosoi CBS 271.37]KIW84400.1 hypothetical protein Z517_03650 [Fonsecaea pedrosoi CBS 271.37]